MALLRYAPKKEVTAVLSLLFPRGQLFAVDAAFNMTVPAFDSCTFALRLIEKETKNYNVIYKIKIIFPANFNFIFFFRF